MRTFRCLLVLLFLGQSSMGFSQLDFREFDYNTDRVRFEKAVYESWNYSLRNGIDSLPLIADFLSKIKGDKYIDALSFTCMGSFYWRSGKIDLGIEFLIDGLELCGSLGNDQLASDISNELGNAFFLQGEMSKASEYYIVSLRFGIKSNDYTSGFNGILGLGKSICANGDTLLGVDLISSFLMSSINHSKYESAADACAFLGMIFFELGDESVAKMYYKQSVAYAKKSSSKTHLANALTNQAIIDAGNDQMKLAEKNFLLAKDCREELGAKKPIIDAYFNLGTYYIMNKRYNEANDYLVKASEIAKESGMIRDEFDAIEVLLLAFPDSFLKMNQVKFGKRFEFLKELLAKKKEISFEVRELSSQIAKTGSAEVLNERKIDRVFWLWFGFFTILVSCSIVLYLNRPKTKGQFSL